MTSGRARRVTEGGLKREYVHAPLHSMCGMAVPQLVWVNVKTGGSRFVMIPLGDAKLPVDRVAAARDSIWARAYAEFRNGFQYWSTDEEMDAILARNSDFDLIDPWSELLWEWLFRHGTAPRPTSPGIRSIPSWTSRQSGRTTTTPSASGN